jgi:hypothetical protein
MGMVMVPWRFTRLYSHKFYRRAAKVRCWDSGWEGDFLGIFHRKWLCLKFEVEQIHKAETGMGHFAAERGL